ncbi:MAG: hypothetical protein QG609_220 [Patescibacteria group bacterium]|nr:hypothetical protein [Patescibacteria group bacterium]
MIKKILLSVFLGALITSGVSADFVLAQNTPEDTTAPSGQGVNGCATGNFQQLISCVTSTILNPMVGLLIGVALVVFLWGIVKYISSGADSTKRKEGAALVFYGVIGLFVMISVWGLVSFLTNTFFGTSGPAANPPIPTITTS